MLRINQERVEKLQSLPKLQALKLVYQWVKTGVISEKEMIHYLTLIK